MSTETLLFCAKNSSELCTSIAALKISVPSRKERQTWQCEQWQMHDFLQYLKSANCLMAPVALRKREKPDFRLNLRGIDNKVYQHIFGPQCYGDLEVGIECSEVINQSEAEQMAWEEAQSETELVLLCEDGYAADSIEREFAKCISYRVQRKHKRLMKDYERFSVDLLLLYYNNFRPPIRFDLAVSRAAEELSSYWTKSTPRFDTVIVRVARELMVFKSDYFGLLPSPNMHG